MNDLEQIRIDLLIWAGIHRGKNISEEAMPRFHEIIDKLEMAAHPLCMRCGDELVERGMKIVKGLLEQQSNER